MVTHHVTSALVSAIDELVYRHDDPRARGVQARRVEVILFAIVTERTRQERIGVEKRAQGIDWRSCADLSMDGGDMTRVAVLGEEFGEVANAALERVYSKALDDRHLREELIQVAAVAVAWLEAIEERIEYAHAIRDIAREIGAES